MISFCRYEYCGNFIDDGNESITQKESTTSFAIKSRFKYLQNNANSIASNCFVSLNTDGGVYTIESTPFYSNNGALVKLLQPYWMFKYQNSGIEELLLFGIYANYPVSRMALRIDDDNFNIALHQQEDKSAWFILPMKVLIILCEAKYVDICTNIKSDANAQYDELPTFACCFYNAAFDRMKYIYSMNVRIITDS